MAAMAVAGGYGLASLVASLQLAGPQNEAAEMAVSPAEPQIAPDLANVPGAGDAVVARMLNNLEGWPNLAAKLRQSVHVGENHISGAGEYWQRGVGNLRRTAWRLRSLEGEKSTSYEQIYTGKYLWTDRRLAEEPRVTRVDVERVARELNLDVGRFDRPASDSAPSVALARGGLSQLVAELQRCFTFTAPVPARHEDLAVEVMIGSWRPEVIEVLWPGAVGGGSWPEHLPHHVMIATGRDNFFPYVIEYRRVAQQALAESDAGLAPSADPLARYEFFEVRFAATMPERIFEYASNDVKWRDVTARTVERLKAMAPKVAASRPVQR